MANRKTTTSTDVKRRWNEANYSRLTIYLPKAQAEEYKSKCDRLGISQSDVPKEAISQFLNERFTCQEKWSFEHLDDHHLTK